MDTTDIRPPAPPGADGRRPSSSNSFVIGQATGILMERHGLDADAALEQLGARARSQGVSIERCAEEVAGRPDDLVRLDALQIRFLHGIELTSRELDVLRLIVSGCSNAEIGERLFVSPETVKTYTRRLFGKLGVTSRTQAAVWALRSSCDPSYVCV